MAAMRFFLAYQSASTWQAQFPLTEEDFLPRLHEWATAPASTSRCPFPHPKAYPAAAP